MAEAKRFRLLVVVSHPVQYHVHTWRALAALPEVDLHVLYIERKGLEAYHDEEFGTRVQWDTPLLEGYESSFLPQGSAKYTSGTLQLWRMLSPSRFDGVLLHGLYECHTFLAMVLGRLRGLRVLYRSETFDLDGRGPVKAILRRAFYRLAFLFPHAFFHIGTHNRAFLRRSGVPCEKITWLPYNAGLFGTEEAKAEPDASLGAARETGRPIVLFSGKLIPKKQPDMILRAFLASRLRGSHALVFVGEGEMRPVLERAAGDEMGRSVFLAGFVNQSSLPAYYRASQIVALQSAFTETWGLVVNEGLAFGCAAVVSDRVGSAPDLVEGRTGLVVPHDSEERLREAFDAVAADPRQVAGWRRAAPEIAARYTPEKQAELFAAFLREKGWAD